MATCLCDAFYDDVAVATVQVLEYLGCAVEFPEGQTCCGQPAFNCGDWKSSRKVLRHTLGVFPGDAPIVVPSGSCAAMLFHGAALAFEHEPDEAPQLARSNLSCGIRKPTKTKRHQSRLNWCPLFRGKPLSTTSDRAENAPDQAM